MMTRFLCLLIIFSNTSIAQINVGSLQNPDKRSGAGDLRRNNIRSLQRTKTIFFYGEKDKVLLDQYKNVMKEEWKLSEVEFDDIANFDNYEKQRNISFITIEVEPVEQLNTNLGRTKTVGYKAYYHIWIPASRGPESFARIDLFLNFEDEAEMLKIEKDDERLEYVYSKATAYNWNPGFARVYFSFINNILMKEKTFALYNDIMEQDSIADLANTTLFVPDYIMTSRDPISKEVTFQPAMDLFAKYPFHYEVKNTEELGEMLYNKKGYFRFLLYTLSGDEKHISIFDSEGKLLYHEFNGNALNLDDKDLKTLAKTID